MPLDDLKPLRAQIAENDSVIGGVITLVDSFITKIREIRDRLDPKQNVNRRELQAELEELDKQLEAQKTALAGAVAAGTAAANEPVPAPEGAQIWGSNGDQPTTVGAAPQPGEQQPYVPEGNGLPAGAAGAEEAPGNTDPKPTFTAPRDDLGGGDERDAGMVDPDADPNKQTGGLDTGNTGENLDEKADSDKL